MTLRIEDLKKEIESRYVGFSPSSSQIKPAHVANGMFRAILEEYADTKLLNNFVVTQTDNGAVPRNHELVSVYQRLIERDGVDTMDITQEHLTTLRVFLKKVVNADNAVYLNKDRMEAYSGSAIGLVSNARLFQDSGEFVAEWIKLKSPSLADAIKVSLRDENDIVTTLCLPLLDRQFHTHIPDASLKELQYFSTGTLEPNRTYDGLKEGADTLAKHLEKLPNKLAKTRLAVSFACFSIVRHLSDLELSWGLSKSRIPFLLDFSGSDSDPIAKASALTYTLCCQAISRFYGWAFGKRLSHYFDLTDISADSPPSYRNRETPEMKEVWKMAVDSPDFADDPFTMCGQALYDCMALEAEGNPIVYLRQLGHRCGLLYPPLNLKPTKRFSLQLDMLETLIRSTVNPGETIGLGSLQTRLWDRFGVMVGGREIDEQTLIDVGVHQADSVALDENQRRFSSMLGNLGFATLLADDVLQIKL